MRSKEFLQKIFFNFLMNYEVEEFLQKIFFKSLPAVGLELLNLGLLGRPLIHHYGIILIFDLPNELWEICTENFLHPSPCTCRRSVSNWWILGCWAVVLSTRPRSSCWENNFGTSWWVMRSRNLNKISWSKSLPGVQKEQPFKNYTKFFGGNLGLEHLHSPAHTIFSSKNSQLAPTLPENLHA